jgi:hypothetical protein
MVTRSLATSIIVLTAAIGSIGVADASIAYSSFDGSEFGTVDLATGQTTIIADLATPLAGLGVAEGELFAAASGETTIFRVDPNTGSLTSVGTTPFAVSALGSTTAGLFALDGGGNLYSIDPDSVATTFIGSVGFSGCCLSNGGDTLYKASLDGNLRAVNTTTGTPTLIWTTSGYGIGGMVFDQGSFYTMLGNPPGELSIFDVGTLSRDDIAGTGKNILSLAVLSSNSSATPEPTSLVLLGTALLALCLCRKRHA